MTYDEHLELNTPQPGEFQTEQDKIDHIIHAVERHTHLTDIFRKCQKFEYCYARFLFYHTCREMGFSLQKTIDLAERKNHVTVINALDYYFDLLDSDKTLLSDFELFQETKWEV